MDKLTRREFLRLSALTAGATVLAACAPQAAPTTAPAPAPTTAPAAAPTTAAATVVPTVVPAAYPIVKEPLTLTYWVPATANVMATLKTFGEMTCYKELEKKTGIHLEFQ
ncbi:MAG: substrate-binding domain-containing protein, partial [Anaerolineales bacterium]|nr:substrate-binding domain-containing protein [Anaerolineales bacterium]